jgi:hypothetical protein
MSLSGDWELSQGVSATTANDGRCGPLRMWAMVLEDSVMGEEEGPS